MTGNVQEILRPVRAWLDHAGYGQRRLTAARSALDAFEDALAGEPDTGDVDAVARLIAPVLRSIEVEAVGGITEADTLAAARRIAERLASVVSTPRRDPADEPCDDLGSHPRGKHHETLAARSRPPADTDTGRGQ